MKQIKILIVLFMLGACIPGFAYVYIPDVLSDGMVLQQGAAVPIWGKALPREAVTVHFQGQEKSTVADASGKWMIFLEGLTADGVGKDLEITGINRITIHNVFVGEVWLCAGQSNMQRLLSETNKGDSVIATATNPMLHLFNVSRDNSFGHKQGAIGSWASCTPESVKEFSAAAYYFGMALQKKLGVPVGIINSSFGGSQAEAWTPITYLQTPELFPCLQRDTLLSSQRAAVQAKFALAMGEWKKSVAKSKLDGEKPKRAPSQPEALREYRPAASIYDHMIAPLMPYGIKGAFWYQGESNESRAEQYGYLLPVMIRSWRDGWHQGNFPFGIIQLPNYRSIEKLPVDQPWSHIREAQRITADTVANTGLIVTIDIGEARDIHPKDKLSVGLRMYQWALGAIYKLPVLPSGPLLESAKPNAKGNKMVVTFKSVGTGLETRDHQAPHSFAIAGADQKWHWAEAKLTAKDQITVWSKKVPKPVAVRYAFNNNPENPNLTNNSGLPASPFRTDNWPGPTHGQR
ncbi:MAG TPA: sialate O-acetylesterase [Arachidicoccus sp.]|nr:sialate O-acetylesterase [Arachidicoccus sp.]